MKRRQFLRLAPALAAAALEPLSLLAQARAPEFADMHSHLGIIGPQVSVREAMTQNGMLVLARKIVADAPVIRRAGTDGAIQQYREPARGELASRFDTVLERLRNGHRPEGLAEIATVADLERVLHAREPAVVLAAEGGDFLEGDLKRLEAAHARGLAHLQLVHYRVSELGDISTERPVHGGLTAFGKEVVAACNRLGVLVDVAHATSDGIAQALEISAKPLVYSHGQIVTAAPYFTQRTSLARGIHRPLAQAMAKRGGVIGIWPLGTTYRTLDGYAGALIDAAETVGAAHVGVGSDLYGLAGNTVMPSYQEFAALEALLAKRGVKPEDIRNLLGGNYLRVLRQALP